jgi:hypothetical protein
MTVKRFSSSAVAAVSPLALSEAASSPPAVLIVAPEGAKPLFFICSRTVKTWQQVP